MESVIMNKNLFIANRFQWQLKQQSVIHQYQLPASKHEYNDILDSYAATAVTTSQRESNRQPAARR